LKRIAAAAHAGIDLIQIREKDLSGRELLELSRDALAIAKEAEGSSTPSTRILLNDRLDVAVATQAHGVHLGENSSPVDAVKRWLERRTASQPPREFLVGASCHSLESCRIAEQGGADYVIFGPVFSTPSKISFGSPQGLDGLAQVCNSLHIPVLAIGGITGKNSCDCIAAGASGLAAIRLFQNRNDLLSTVMSLRCE
jgi:thiamine-phosphate pyrophosphorylase